MNSGETFNWPDGDVVLHCTHGAESRDFQVHKFFLSFVSPVFKDMFQIPRPPQSTPTTIDTVDLADSPRALELVLRFIYPSTIAPVIDDLAIVSDALTLADKYDIEVVRSRLRTSLMEHTTTEPLRVYAIACRLGFEDEMKTASSHTVSINLPALAQLPEEFKFVLATEYHRLVHLHTRHREAAAAIAANLLSSQPIAPPFAFGGSAFGGSAFGVSQGERVASRTALNKPVVDIIMKGTPLDYGSLTNALNADYGIDIEADGTGHYIRSILNKIDALNLTV